MNTSIKDNSLALSAALKEGKDTNLISSLSTSHRRSMGSRKGLESSSMGAPSSFGSYLVRGNSAPRKHQTPDSIEEDETAVTETTNGSTDKNVSTKNRSRRASEGSHLVKGEGKRVSSELRCDRCGKGYKHSSCLTKHMWVSPRPCLWIPDRIWRSVVAPSSATLFAIVVRPFIDF